MNLLSRVSFWVDLVAESVWPFPIIPISLVLDNDPHFSTLIGHSLRPASAQAYRHSCYVTLHDVGDHGSLQITFPYYLSSDMVS